MALGDIIVGGGSGRVYKTTSSLSSWTELQPDGNADNYWAVLSASADFSVIVAGEWNSPGNGHVKISIDGGSTWNTPPSPVAGDRWLCASVSGDGNTILIGSYQSPGYLWLSTNRGVSFTETIDHTNNYAWACSSISYDGQKIIAGCQGLLRGLILTANKGGSWSAVKSYISWSFVATSDDFSVIFASEYTGRVWLSTDSGATMNETQPKGNTDGSWLVGGCNSTGSMLVTAENGGRIYYSTNFGSTWSEFRPVGDVDNNWQNISVDSSGNTIIVGSVGGAFPGTYITTDAGSTWNPVYPAGGITPYPSRSSYIVKKYVFAGPFYVDISQTTTGGSGTPLSPFGWNEFLAQLSGSSGIFYLKGTRILSVDATVTAISATVEAWDIATNGPWRITCNDPGKINFNNVQANNGIIYSSDLLWVKIYPYNYTTAPCKYLFISSNGAGYLGAGPDALAFSTLVMSSNGVQLVTIKSYDTCALITKLAGQAQLDPYYDAVTDLNCGLDSTAVLALTHHYGGSWTSTSLTENVTVTQPLPSFSETDLTKFNMMSGFGVGVLGGWAYVAPVTNFYVDLTASGTGHDGTSGDPFSYTDFISSVNSTNGNTYNLSGFISIGPTYSPFKITGTNQTIQATNPANPWRINVTLTNPSPYAPGVYGEGTILKQGILFVNTPTNVTLRSLDSMYVYFNDNHTYAVTVLFFNSLSTITVTNSTVIATGTVYAHIIMEPSVGISFERSVIVNESYPSSALIRVSSGNATFHNTTVNRDWFGITTDGTGTKTDLGGNTFGWSYTGYYPLWNDQNLPNYNFQTNYGVGALGVWAYPPAGSYYVDLSTSGTGHSGTTGTPFSGLEFLNRVRPGGNGNVGDTYYVTGTLTHTSSSNNNDLQLVNFTKITSWFNAPAGNASTGNRSPWRIVETYQNASREPTIGGASLPSIEHGIIDIDVISPLTWTLDIEGCSMSNCYFQVAVGGSISPITFSNAPSSITRSTLIGLVQNLGVLPVSIDNSFVFDTNVGTWTGSISCSQCSFSGGAAKITDAGGNQTDNTSIRSYDTTRLTAKDKDYFAPFPNSVTPTIPTNSLGFWYYTADGIGGAYFDPKTRAIGLPLNTPTPGTLATALSSNWYKVHLYAGRDYVITLGSPEIVCLVDVDGESIINWTGGVRNSSYPVSFTFSCTVTDDYYIVVIGAFYGQYPNYTSFDTNFYDFIYSGNYTLTITGDATPVVSLAADFTGTPRIGYPSLEVTFTDTSFGSPTGWTWTLGDGNTIAGISSFMYSYATPGMYTVQLDIVDASFETSSVTKEGYIIVEAPVNIPSFNLVESTSSAGTYWKMYLTEDGYIVFETESLTYRSKDKIVNINVWSFVHIDFFKEDSPSALRIFFGDSNRIYKEIDMIATYTPSPETPTSNRLYAALNSTFKIDELKIWGRLVDDKAYFNSLQGQASKLDQP